MSFRYRKDVLPNGLRVVTVETPHLHTALLAVYVRTGSRHETVETNGISHFLEHLFFRGSERFRDTVAMNARVEEVGGNLNGVTTREHGFYYTPIHPKHLDVGLEIIGDMLQRPLLTHMDVERQVILEEMLDEVDEHGRDIDVDNLAKMELFRGNPLAMKIAGTADSVKALTLEQVKEHFARNYVARNMVVAASGRVSHEEVLELSARVLGALVPGEVTTDLTPGPGPKGPWFKFVTHDEAQTDFRVSFRTVPELHADHAALHILRRVLDDGLSSRLPFNVVEQRGLAYSIQCNMESFHDVGLFDIDAASAPDKAPLVVEEIGRTLLELCEKGPTEAELERAKKRHRMFLEFAEDSPVDLAAHFGSTEVFYPPLDFETWCKRIEAETVESVRAVARKYFRPDNVGLVAVGQKKGTKALEKSIQDLLR